MYAKRRQRGWLMIEVVVTVSILVLLGGAMTAVLLSAGNGNRMLWARQQAATAVEAQLDCLTQSGAALPAGEFERLWPDLACTIDSVGGEGPTAGLERVAVTVTGRVKTKTIAVTGQRYIVRREP